MSEQPKISAAGGAGGAILVFLPGDNLSWGEHIWPLLSC